MSLLVNYFARMPSLESDDLQTRSVQSIMENWDGFQMSFSSPDEMTKQSQATLVGTRRYTDECYGSEVTRVKRVTAFDNIYTNAKLRE